nr:Chromosome partition protein Smc [Candidatus Prometheoarchaeum syntrophicum]
MICIGFKSFRKRTVINFDEGFSAIVGANGSGKSNIIDAFVFVLGALSAKSLRANNIKDLISNGGHGMGPSDTASVEILFDNADRSFSLDLPEISILRKIDRKGNGIYKLNGKRSTRKAIINLLDLSGILPNSSNMIMQGELFRLINMNSNERRELIEDIAGIASYNDKKISAEDELMQVQTNLGQIALLLNEVYLQLEDLKKEKINAEKYLELTSQEKIRTNALYKVKIQTSEEKIEKMAEEKIEVNIKIAEIEKKEVQLKEEIETLKQKIEELEPKIQKLQDSELLQMTNKLKDLKNKVTELKTSLSYAKKNLKTYQQEQLELQERLNQINEQEENLKKEIKKIEAKKQKIIAQINEKTQIIQDLEKKLSTIDVEYIQIKENSKRLQIEIDQIKEEKNQCSGDLRLIEQKIEGLTESKSKLEKKIFDSHNVLAGLKIKIENLKIERKQKLGLEDIDFSKNGIEKKINRMEKEIEGWNINRKEMTSISNKTQKELFELKSKVKILNHITSNNRAQRAILNLSKTGKIKGIFGTISQLGSTSKKYYTAMEYAAGNRFNFIVVENQIVAEKCINHLKKNKLGRATFIPLENIHYKPFISRLPEDSKIIGRAVDLIEFSEKYRDAFEYVFGRCVIVEDIPTARGLKIPAKRVTLEGDVVEGSNLMTGGQKTKSKGLGFDNNNDQQKIKELESAHQIIHRQISELDIKINAHRVEISRLYKLKITGANKTKEISEQIAVCKASIEQLLMTISNNENEIEEIIKEIDGQSSQKEKLEQGIDKIKKILTNLINKENEIQEKLDSSEESSIKQQLKQNENQLKNLQKEATQIEIEFTKKSTSLTETISSNRATAQTQLNQRNHDIAETTNSIQELSNDLKDYEVKVKVLEEKISHKSKALTVLMNEKKNLTMNMSENQLKVGQIGNEVYPLKMNLNTFEIKTTEFKQKILEWGCFINPEIEVSEDLLKISESNHQKEIVKIELQKNQLGAVNLRAIDKYIDIEERFKELGEKNERVIKEREAILDFIESLEQEKKKVFLNTFNAINKNFGYIFSRLSKGGEAKLELENLEDPFEGGVLILARPGEKKWCLTQAMSGGEKTLTIIALILGIQMHVPSPYYILDEIDAALDDVNAALVADMVKELSEKSQFIIITHRDVTMARVDHLLGVSNIEGVTSVINLSIRNVLKQLESKNSAVQSA